MSEEKRRENNRDKVLRFLQERGRQGATNAELNAICFRYGARIYDLRREGYSIVTTAGEAGLFRFVLRGRNVEQLSLFQEVRQ